MAQFFQKPENALKRAEGAAADAREELLSIWKKEEGSLPAGWTATAGGLRTLWVLSGVGAGCKGAGVQGGRGSAGGYSCIRAV